MNAYISRKFTIQNLKKVSAFFLAVFGLGALIFLLLQEKIPGFNCTASKFMWLNFAAICVLFVSMGLILRYYTNLARLVYPKLSGSASDSTRLFWINRITLFLLIFAGCSIFFWKITAPSLMHDEFLHSPGTSFSMSGKSYDLCHFYYWVNECSVSIFENKEFALRAPQALAAALSLIFVYLISRHLFSSGAGLVAIFMLITNRFFVRYAQENRLYQIGSLCFLAAFYFFIKFIETRKWYIWVGVVAACSMSLRTYHYGVMAIAMLGFLTILLILLNVSAGSENAPYNISLKTLIWLGAAAIVVSLLWMPYPIKFLKMFGKSGANVSMGRFGWHEYIPVTLKGFLNYLQTNFAGFSSWSFHIPLLAAITGGIFYRKGKPVVFFVYSALVTLVLFYIMNSSRGVAYSRRMLYLCPVVMILFAGGIDMMAKVCRDGAILLLNFIQKLKSSTVITKKLSAIIFTVSYIVLLWIFAFPIVGNGLHKLGQYYFEDRDFHKLTARVLTTFAKPSDQIWLCRSGHIQKYIPASANLRIQLKTHSVGGIENALKNSKRLWVFARNPDTKVLRKFNFATIPVLKWWKGDFVLLLFDRDYAENNSFRIKDEEKILDYVVKSNFYPRAKAAVRLAEVLLERGNTNEADAIVREIGNASTHRVSVNFATTYFAKRNLRKDAARLWQRHAACYFWMAEPQLRAAWGTFAAGQYNSAIRYARFFKFLGDGKKEEANKIIAKAKTRLRKKENIVFPAEKQKYSNLKNLIKNGTFSDEMLHWKYWQKARNQTNLLFIINKKNKLKVAKYLRVENPNAQLIGVAQSVNVFSGAVYRLCGTVRSTVADDSRQLFGGRIGFWLPPQKEKQIVWMHEYNKWWEKELLFTNEVTGTATIYVHMGYGNISSTGEFTNIRLEKIRE